LSSSEAAVRSSVCSDEDIDLISLLGDLEATQLETPVDGALTGLEVVFVAVPRTDQVGLGIGEPLAEEALLLVEDGFDAAQDPAFADRAPLVDAAVLVGVEAAPVEQDANLGAPRFDEAPGVVGEVRPEPDQDLGFAFLRRRSAAAASSRPWGPVGARG